MDVKKLRGWLAISELRLKEKSSDSLRSIYERQLLGFVRNTTSRTPGQAAVQEEQHLINNFFRSVVEDVKNEVEYVFRIAGLPSSRASALWDSVMERIKTPGLARLDPNAFVFDMPNDQARQAEPDLPAFARKKSSPSVSRDLAGLGGAGLILGAIRACLLGNALLGTALFIGGSAIVSGSWGADYKRNKNKPFDGMRRAFVEPSPRRQADPAPKPLYQDSWKDVIVNHSTENVRILNRWIESITIAALRVGEAY